MTTAAEPVNGATRTVNGWTWVLGDGLVDVLPPEPWMDPEVVVLVYDPRRMRVPVGEHLPPVIP